AGAIIEGGTGTASSKREALEAAGAVVVDRPSAIVDEIRAQLGVR
ncbi:MAG: succinate--CoA ligase subunit alpha, partial [Methanothermobacter sp.]|nr:succinate--CoA ligase subunit alpha [Methanothermobacter sp.]